MKLALLCLLVSACVTRTVVAPAAPAPTQYRRAADILLHSRSGQGAKCDVVVSTEAYDSASCELANGAQMYAWHSMTNGYGYQVLWAPAAPQAQPVTPPAPASTPAPATAPSAPTPPKKKP